MGLDGLYYMNWVVDLLKYLIILRCTQSSSHVVLESANMWIQVCSNFCLNFVPGLRLEGEYYMKWIHKFIRIISHFEMYLMSITHPILSPLPRFHRYPLPYLLTFACILSFPTSYLTRETVPKNHVLIREDPHRKIKIMIKIIYLIKQETMNI